MYGLRDEQLEAVLKDWGQPKFRLKQIRDCLYGDAPAGDIDAMHTLPKALRARLREHATLGELGVEFEQQSKDGTQKRLWRCHDGSLIESVLMPYDDRRSAACISRTACISSQVGCAMGCTFCATGQMGFRRDLSEAEIFEQAARFSSELRARGERLSNVVFMGMGEPFRNYDAVSRRIMDELGIGARHVTVSTVGLAPQIRRRSPEIPRDCIGNGLMSPNQRPRGRALRCSLLRCACHYYVERSGRRLTFEWAPIAARSDAVAFLLCSCLRTLLGKLLRGLKCHVNLIPLNPTQGFDGAPASLPDAREFVEVLGRSGIPATVRVRRGIDIDAGCGQL
uniref:Radical SAM core domain-containing protein n=1 Tax=Emiliania huxleyi (strain CCMP1516) TaxID=280463 RepID=A0A0D3I1N4_EMIH1